MVFNGQLAGAKLGFMLFVAMTSLGKALSAPKPFVANYSYLLLYGGALHECCASWCRREVAKG
jgi:hypothetical protein